MGRGDRTFLAPWVLSKQRGNAKVQQTKRGKAFLFVGKNVVWAKTLANPFMQVLRSEDDLPHDEGTASFQGKPRPLLWVTVPSTLPPCVVPTSNS